MAQGCSSRQDDLEFITRVEAMEKVKEKERSKPYRFLGQVFSESEQPRQRSRDEVGDSREECVWEQRGNRLEDAREPSVIPLCERESHVRLRAEGSTSSFIFDCSVSLAAAFRIDHRITETNLMLLKHGGQSRCHEQNGGGGEKRSLGFWREHSEDVGVDWIWTKRRVMSTQVI